MVLIAIANGAIREPTYGAYLAEPRAHQISSLSAAVLFGGYIWLLVRIWVKAAGASIAKPPQDTFWGGFSGYFADLDGFYAADGSLRFKT